MFRILEDIDNATVSLEDLKQQWKESFDSMKDETAALSYEKFMNEDYYDKTTYILDTENNICYKANDFFHKFGK